MDITVILPCAGEGSRLNLEYPKELFEIYKDIKLIDFSLQHILYSFNKRNINLKVSVVITEKKEQVFNYIKDKLYPIAVTKVYFNKNYQEWPGSVYSATEMFSDNNLVLLPDSYLTLSKNNRYINSEGKTLLDIVIANLKKYDVIFGYKKTNSNNSLKNLGAMFVKNNIITKFKDKPQEKLYKYNSFWGCYGFKNIAYDKLYEFLVNSISSKNLTNESEFPYQFGGFPLNAYYDLGTWENIKSFYFLNPNAANIYPA